MGETGFCENLRFSAVSCENLRFPAVFCANLRLPNPLIYRASRKSAKICKNLRKCAFRDRFLPFAVSLLARPETAWPLHLCSHLCIAVHAAQPMGPALRMSECAWCDENILLGVGVLKKEGGGYNVPAAGGGGGFKTYTPRPPA